MKTKIYLILCIVFAISSVVIFMFGNNPKIVYVISSAIIALVMLGLLLHHTVDKYQIKQLEKQRKRRDRADKLTKLVMEKYDSEELAKILIGEETKAQRMSRIFMEKVTDAEISAFIADVNVANGYF